MEKKEAGARFEKSVERPRVYHRVDEWEAVSFPINYFLKMPMQTVARSPL